MYERRRLLPFLFAVTATMLAQAPAVPIEQEPLHKLVLQNEYVRVFRVDIPAGASTGMHRHERDYLGLHLTDAEVESQRQGAEPVRLKLHEGTVAHYQGGFAHIARNLGSATYSNVAVELPNGLNLKPVEAHACGCPACPEEPHLYASERATVAKETLAPGAATPWHAHAGPHLAVAIDGGEFRNEVESGESRTLKLEPGQVMWVPPGGRHRLVNLGQSRVRWVAVEFAPPAAH